MHLSSPLIRGLEYTALPLLYVHYVIFSSLSLSPFLSPSLPLSSSLFHLPPRFIPRHLVYSTLYCPTGPACGHASAPHLHPVVNVVNLSKRGPLCAGSRAILQAGNVCGILQRVAERQSTVETRKGVVCRAVIPNESTDLSALNGD